jgi:crotonobetainyl-CoA:carnitine CoA-transferase CaiB-like acyl-CoA transferase
MVGGLLAGIRVVEVAMFAPDAVGMHLADLGAEVIKVEQPGIGDPARLLGQPYRGESPATRRWNRGKRSLTLDLMTPEGVAVFRDLVAASDAVVEGMRAGALARRGVGYETLLTVNPHLVFANVSGWGTDSPYENLGSHGLAFDAFAGLAPPRQVDGRPARPLGHVWTGLEAGPLYAALAIVSGVLHARLTGEPAAIEVSEADAAAIWNGWRISYDAAVARYGADPEDPDQRELVRALAIAAEGAGRPGDHDLTATDVRYQYYPASDGPVLLMATEQKFWRNFCRAIDRLDLFERWPGSGYADHDYGNVELRQALEEVFRRRTRAEWIALFIDHNVAGAPVYAPGETHSDPHFAARGLWLDPDVDGIGLHGSPIRVNGELQRPARPAPASGVDGLYVLGTVLGYDDERVEALMALRPSERPGENSQGPVTGAKARS